ncbi:MAG: hypothetical protein JNJ46_03100 [Myxococcales bacterium]|nr:hypothetical protein [Myxococcales bacterium]
MSAYPLGQSRGERRTHERKASHGTRTPIRPRPRAVPSQRWAFCAAFLLTHAACQAEPPPVDPPTELPDLTTWAPGDCGPLARCGRVCTDPSKDPLNCGGCDRSCVIENATAGCDRGRCIIAACSDGYVDADQRVENGCEQATDCITGARCEATCGSSGRVRCVGARAECEPPAESCNGSDDDCNGRCDDGALPGCRIGVHRAAGPGGHFYTTDLAAATTSPWVLEAANYFYIYARPVPGSHEVYLCRKDSGRHFLHGNKDCDLKAPLGRLLGYWSLTPLCGGQALQRLHNAASDDYFYTLSEAEAQNAIDRFGYTVTTIPAVIWSAP